MSNLSSLPSLGQATYETQYGTYTFGPSTLTTAFNVRPVLDAAKRTVIYNEIEITVEEYLEPAAPSGEGGVDDVVQNATQILSTPGGMLTWTNRGPGPFRINVAPADRDLVWGPVPKLIGITATANNTAKVEWQVSFATTQALAGVSKGQVMEYCYSISWSLDQERMTTRKVSGFIRIPTGREFPGSRLIQDNADRYRELVAMDVPIGFVRVGEDYQLDESKTKLTFTVTDRQMPPNVFPAGVLAAKASHTISNNSGKLAFWTATLEGEFTVARGQPVKAAHLAFWAILRQRQALTAAIKAGEGLPILPEGFAPGSKVCTRPLAFTVSEPEIYGPGEAKVKLSCQYAVVGCGLAAILDKTGLWQPVGNKWGDWATSVRMPYGVRGSAKLVFRPGDDQIQDLNTPGLVPVTPGGGT